jgi:hypothetical protein
VRPEGSWEKEGWLADTLVILAVVYLASGTWVHASAAGGVVLWKSYVSVLVTVFLALAALTRHPYWSSMFRLVLGLWIAAAPFALGIADIGSVLRTYLTTGALIAALSASGIRGTWRRRRRTITQVAPRLADGIEGARSVEV